MAASRLWSSFERKEEASEMLSQHGRFVWYELLTTDTKAAGDFYRKVMGWSAAASPGVPGYTLFSARGAQAQVGGMMMLPKEACDAGARPGWIGYVAVDDVDARAAELAKRGGHIHRAAQDIPGVGRFAMVSDPQGAALALFKDASGTDMPEPAPGTPEQVVWRELRAASWRDVFPFYEKLFGWTKADAIDMGPMGVYQIFARNGQSIGGMMTLQGPLPPHWHYYFAAEAIDAAQERVEGAHGKVLNGPSEVPGGGFSLNCADPQGALFGLFAMRR
jgi:hypothetical protein